MTPYKIIDLQQGSHEWLIWRRSKITASMAGVILGLSPWQTPLQLFNNILSGEESYETPAMSHGKTTEAEARGWLSHEQQCGYKPVCMESIEHPWLGCSLDAWDIHAKVKLAEIKCPIKFDGCIYDLADIPQNYYAQMQHQMAVTGEPKMIFLTYRKTDQSGVILHIKRDDLFIEKMIPLLKTFYDQLASFDAPEPIDGRDIFVLDDPEATNAANLYRQNKNLISELESDNMKLRDLIIRKAEGRSVRIHDMKITKVIRRGNVDYTSIPCLQGIDLEPYRKKPIETWRFS